ncbi:hypothetical protein [Ruegeria atlantica]|uniref:hypothetical protein n=1 Tax=Ruegeria atlantica TaxID=81569 RepID=UPI0014805668|nr:hypothetical protein [Ruegeria atlantica]
MKRKESKSVISVLWEEPKALLGDVIVRWGFAMGYVYNLPKCLGIENYQAVQTSLAMHFGDADRIRTLRRILERAPRPDLEGRDRFKEAETALRKLEKLNETRNRLIHGIPVFSMKADPETHEVIRQGCYLIQQREHEISSKRYVDVIEEATQLLGELNEVNYLLSEASSEMTWEQWQEFFDRVEPEKTTDPG